MVCINCGVSTTAAPQLAKPLLPQSFNRKAWLSSHELISCSVGFSKLERRHRRLYTYRCNVDAVGRSPAPADFEPLQLQRPGSAIFPGGFRRAKIKVPTVILKVDTGDVLRSADAIDVAVSKGFIGIVLLRCGDDNGGQIYEAACVLKSIIRDRAYFLVSERVDISAAVGASGVVLSDQGLPVIVARNMMTSSRTESVILPLVGRNLKKSGSAITASASEGADFLIFNVDKSNYEKVLLDCITAQNIKVPIFLEMVNWEGESPPSDMASNLLQLGASGIILSLDDMDMFTEDTLTLFSNPKRQDINIQDKSQNKKPLIAGFSRLEEREIELIEAERVLLLEATEVIREAAPLVIF